MSEVVPGDGGRIDQAGGLLNGTLLDELVHEDVGEANAEELHHYERQKVLRADEELAFHDEEPVAVHSVDRGSETVFRDDVVVVP
ncbi:unnamed protein product [Phytophthora lilii]|uniref:Unnamed protein product n=1 Tax=Phytophthora lilii TaxID=2077276 RepID=A0A9W7CWI1_9STRA|nr:unnamed protein product [Phytophthora lilii]